MAARSSGVASPPAISAATSPGTIHMIRKDTRETTKRTGMALSSRPRRKRGKWHPVASFHGCGGPVPAASWLSALVFEPDVVKPREPERLEALQIGAGRMHEAGVADLDDPEEGVETGLDLLERLLALLDGRSGDQFLIQRLELLVLLYEMRLLPGESRDDADRAEIGLDAHLQRPPVPAFRLQPDVERR